jgi:hypothetical protein
MATQEQKVKISAAQAAKVYAEVPGVLRKLASEREKLSEKLAAAETELAKYRLNERMSKIAGKMHEKGINGMSFDEHLEQVKEAHTKGRSLDAIEEAVEMTAPNGVFMKVSSDTAGNGETQLEAYLYGGLSE